MKKLIFFLSIAFLLSACGSNEHSAQKMIKQQMKTIVTDAKSYHSISFGALDSLFSTYQKDSTYVQLLRKANNYQSLADQQTKNAITAKSLKATKAIKKMVDAYADSSKMFMNQAYDYAKNFKKTFIGWQMSHTFSMNNPQGMNQVLTYKFYFDKPLNKIVGWEKE